MSLKEWAARWDVPAGALAELSALTGLHDTGDAKDLTSEAGVVQTVRNEARSEERV